ncbi:MAG: hypothetical protein DRP85_08205 [Candidatus Makaraimicrobium thalassicum]|nr:MAG: hypothetical protein DRP85_08205 [Candidatus Omnitrophota bacterium]
MTVALKVVITIVVLLVLALILITLVSMNVIKFSGGSGDSIDTSSLGILCQTELAAACADKSSGEMCGSGCDSCPQEGSTLCP